MGRSFQSGDEKEGYSGQSTQHKIRHQRTQLAGVVQCGACVQCSRSTWSLEVRNKTKKDIVRKP